MFLEIRGITTIMKHIFTISLCFLALSLSAQTEYPYPYNPDGNNDGLISLNDLMDLLALYGLEYNAGVLATDSISAIYYTGEMDYWDCASSCVGLRGNWKILDYNLVGSYKQELANQGYNVWLDLNNSPRGYDNSTLVPFVYTVTWDASNATTNEPLTCFCQTRTRADIEDINLCEGLEDECGVCNGEGAIYECGCTDIPEGDCDCNGNQLDAVGVCGGDCLEDLDGDGVCDPVLGPCEGQDYVTYHDHDYLIVEIGSQCWFAEDLATLSYNDGTPLVICGNFESSPFGSVRLQDGCFSPSAGYNHIAASNVLKNVCPVGWRVANYSDYSSLVNFFGGPAVAGAFLKSIEAGGNNSAGFNAQCRDNSGCGGCGEINGVRYRMPNSSGSDTFFMDLYPYNIISPIAAYGSTNQGSIRCIKD
jgi:uncharacterized protein (TIGR02145 family)